MQGEEEMEPQRSELLNSFMESGIYRLDHFDVVFIDPVRLLNDSYSRFRLSPSAYYSRHFASSSPTPNKKRKRNRKPKDASLNERELCAENRHQQVRPLLLNAHRKLLQASQLLNILPRIVESGEPLLHCRELELVAQHNFVELGSNWRAPFCEIALSNNPQPQGLGSGLPEARKLVPLFDNMISVDSDGDVEAEFQNSTYILPRRSFFLMGSNRLFGLLKRRYGREVKQRHYFRKHRSPTLYNDPSAPVLCNFFSEKKKILQVIAQVSLLFVFLWDLNGGNKWKSDLRQVRKLIPGNSTEGFNLIVIDPPWENGSARQKAMYPTLPNRHFMYLPVKELAHSDGALVALWMTNRKKLQDFVEKDLLPAWGMSHVTPFYWLKVKLDGSLIGDLDLFHHRPYECLLLGYVNVDLHSKCMKTVNSLKKSRVIICVPGAYSRKPPLEKLLSEYIPGQRPSRCIELFARELTAGWTSWGNEPLHFQDSRYFLEK